MIDPRRNSSPKPTNAPEFSPRNNETIALAVSAVQSRAYELYELRGRIDGFAEQDWYQAETDLTSGNRAINLRNA